MPVLKLSCSCVRSMYLPLGDTSVIRIMCTHSTRVEKVIRTCVCYTFSFLFSLKRMENKFISGNSMDIFFMFVCCIVWCPNAVDWHFMSLKFVWLEHLTVVTRRGCRLFLCLLMLRFFCLRLRLGRAHDNLVHDAIPFYEWEKWRVTYGPVLTHSPVLEQSEYNT